MTTLLLKNSRKLLVFLAVSFFLLGFVAAQSETPTPVGSYSGELDVNQENGVVTIGGPASPDFCGNNIIESSRGEQCDGANLDGKTCSDIDSNTQGTLSCKPNCIYDTSQCTSINPGSNNNNGGGGGSSGGGGNNIGTYTQLQHCVENWECTDWGVCAEGSQTRTCTDTKNCTTTLLMPEIQRLCETKTLLNADADSKDSQNGFSSLLGAIIGPNSKPQNLAVVLTLMFLVLGALLIINSVRKNTNAAEKAIENKEI